MHLLGFVCLLGFFVCLLLLGFILAKLSKQLWIPVQTKAGYKSLVVCSFSVSKSKENPHSKSKTNTAVHSVLEGRRVCMNDTCIANHLWFSAKM